MKKYLIGPVLLVAALSAGCASALQAAPTPNPNPAGPRAQVGARISLTGQLVLKGSMPMLQAVLILKSGERWELKNVQPMSAARLQNKKVVVEGQVVRHVGTAMLYPSLTVTNIELEP